MKLNASIDSVSKNVVWICLSQIIYSFKKKFSITKCITLLPQKLCLCRSFAFLEILKICVVSFYRRICLMTKLRQAETVYVTNNLTPFDNLIIDRISGVLSYFIFIKQKSFGMCFSFKFQIEVLLLKLCRSLEVYL